MAKILLTTMQAAVGFGISDMTIYTWRAGTPTRDKLPVVKGAKGEPATSVRFDADALAKYAKKHGLTFDLSKAQAYVKPKAAAKTAPAKKVGKPVLKAVAVKKASAKAVKLPTKTDKAVAKVPALLKKPAAAQAAAPA